MTALPSGDEAAALLRGCSPAFDLYATYLLPAEQAGSEAGNAVHVMNARVVGYLLLYAYSDKTRGALVSEIASCRSRLDGDQYEALYDLGDVYLKNLIRAFKRTREGNPVRLRLSFAAFL
ncbi:hypothetical protein BD311DRAFT_414122 [Dichomitus squalens]|uniref:Uncharacterized protein n=1 Tax=Dichomitus squalens TaxID=114155 RepID=A0A4Q9ML03_9APHY|nr:hypothetical protein BD311DRAFT_414122 [Dichomitus squalens]